MAFFASPEPTPDPGSPWLVGILQNQLSFSPETTYPMKQTVHLCRAMVRDEVRDYVTVLPPEVVFAHGMPGRSIVGVMLRPLGENEAPSMELFTPNAEFVRFLHEVLSRHATEVEGLRDAARRIGEGYVYVLDARTPDPAGTVPLEDIIGAVQVKGGVPVPGSYRANTKHQLLTERGFFQLEEELNACLLRELGMTSPDN